MPVNISDINIYPYTYDVNGRVNVRTLSAGFGEGYEERRTKGINPITTTWQVTFIFNTLAETRSFIDLLQANLADHVLWKSPTDTTPQKYVFSDWGITPRESANIFNISVNLRRWYGN